MRQQVQQAYLLGGKGSMHAGIEKNHTEQQMLRVSNSERANFRALVRSVSTDRRLIVSGMEGATVAVRLRRADGASGTIIVRVVGMGHLRYVQVIGSDYPPIQSHGGALILPIFALFRTEYPEHEIDEGLRRTFGGQLHELWEALTWACGQMIAEYMQYQSPQPPVQTVDVPVTETVAPPVFERTIAVPLTGKELMVKPRFWRTPYFSTVQGAYRAYYHRKMVGGVRVLSLIDAEDGHPFAPIFKLHSEVAVKIDDIILPKWESVRIGDIADRAEAEKCVAKHINLLLPSMDFAPRPHHMKKM